MEIIPVINCYNPQCVEDRLKIIEALELDENIIHIDISDGKFAEGETWNDPDGIKNIVDNLNMKVSFEVHLMVDDPVEELSRWALLETKKIIAPIEALDDPELFIRECEHLDIIPVLSADPHTSIDRLLEYQDICQNFQILLVHPGPSGQIPDKDSLQKISELRTVLPNAIIEVDGGITPEVARIIKDAGADTIVSSSFIFDSESPIVAFKELKESVK